MLLQMHEKNAATESAHSEAGDKAFQTGTDLTKKENLCALTLDDEQRWNWNNCCALARVE